MIIKPFKEPIFVTRPLLPDLKKVTKRLEKVWSSQWLTNNGPQHIILENKIKQFLKVENVSLFNNGTIALIVACQALKLKGEVITTPFTFAATTHVLKWNNITPVFCDIEKDTFNIDADKIEKLITPKTSAILAVHVFGNPCNVEKIQRIAKKYNIKVIYDAAHAFGTEIDGKGIGTFGDVTMFSFHATKLFHTAEGGALVMNDKALKQDIDYLKNFGIKTEEEIIKAGINGKMNELQASVGIEVLELVKREWKKREIIRREYIKNLSKIEGIGILDYPKNIHSSYQYFPIVIDEKKFGRSRNFIHSELKKYNVISRKYFYPLCSNFECYREFKSSNKKNLPIANEIANNIITLPFYGALNLSDVKTICYIIKTLKK